MLQAQPQHPCGCRQAQERERGNGGGNHRADIPQQVADRASVQKDKAELPAEIFLRRQQKRSQNANMGGYDCLPASHGSPQEGLQGRASMGFLEYAQSNKMPHDEIH